MVSKRKRRRKLKKNFKRFLISLPILLVLILIIIFGFRIKKVNYESDLGQYNATEVQTYLKEHGINNSLMFWFKNAIGLGTDIDLFDEYSVNLKSPIQVTIKAQEKQLRGSFIYGENYFYFDETGELLKSEACAYKEIKKGKKKIIKKVLPNALEICCYNNVAMKEAKLYEPLKTKEEEGAKTILNMTEALREMELSLEKVGKEDGKNLEIRVTKINVSDKYELTMVVKGGLKVAFGKDNQLKEKMNAFVDIYGSSREQLMKNAGTLQMQWLSDDNSYTFIKNKKKKK